MVKQIYWANNGELGYRRITMELRRKFNLLVNHKKVLRIMQDFGLKSKIRKTKKHATAQRKNENWTIAENILKSNFKVNKPNSERRNITDIGTSEPLIDWRRFPPTATSTTTSQTGLTSTQASWWKVLK